MKRPALWTQVLAAVATVTALRLWVPWPDRLIRLIGRGEPRGARAPVDREDGARCTGG